MQNYHYNEIEFCDFDKYIEDKTHNKYSKTALGNKFYEILIPIGGGLVWEMSPLQHKYGYIDILKTKMNKKEIEILSSFRIFKIGTEKLKRNLECDLKKFKARVQKKEKHEREKLIKNYSKENNVPCNYEEWPIMFELIQKDDSLVKKKIKREKLRECLNRRIAFMKDCVYDCGKINQKWVEGHMDFIVKLQILAATHGA